MTAPRSTQLCDDFDVTASVTANRAKKGKFPFFKQLTLPAERQDVYAQQTGQQLRR